MARLLFKLKHVPEDEADEVRALLEAHGLETYETPGGRWGFSVEAIWLRHDADLPRARELLDAYQAERQARVRAEYRELEASGATDTFLRRLLREPLRALFLLGIAALVLYFSIKPFVSIGG